MFDFSADTGLFALAASSFVAATILPGGSEFVLIGVLHRYPELLWQAIGVAAIFNTLGGLTSYALGRLLPNHVDARALRAVRRYGPWVLLFSWLPLIGDALAVGAGWLRLNLVAVTAAFAVGKLCRYIVVAGAWSLFEAAALR